MSYLFINIQLFQITGRYCSERILGEYTNALDSAQQLEPNLDIHKKHVTLKWEKRPCATGPRQLRRVSEESLLRQGCFVQAEEDLPSQEQSGVLNASRQSLVAPDPLHN